MRIWDLSPGYLNRGSLLGEHRELHGIHSILVKGKKGYSRHPETLRWAEAIGGLGWRHCQLVSEMRLRGYVDRTPLQIAGPVQWPVAFVTRPGEQIALLKQKYQGREPGRIPLPRNAQELWAQHKYSVMARSPETGRSIGRALGEGALGGSVGDMAEQLVEILREPPATGRLANALEHMWGHVRHGATADQIRVAASGMSQMLALTRELALEQGQDYLLHSTALSELEPFVDPGFPTT